MTDRSAVIAEDPPLPVPGEGVETAFLPPEAVLLDTASGTVHRLSPGATAVWMLLEHGQTRHSLAAELADLFDTAPSALVAEVDLALDEFRRHDLVVDSGARVRQGGERTRCPLPRPDEP